MATWVLIIFLGGFYSNSGVAGFHVPGFKSEADCQLAARKAVEMKTGSQNATAVCVKQ